MWYEASRSPLGKLVNQNNNLLKENIATYLSDYRMINDYVEINDAKVVNLQTEVDLFVDKSYNINEVKANAIQVINEFMDVDNWEMNENIYISQITDQLREVPGVINVVDIRFYNMESGGYSDTVHFQATSDRLLLSTGGFRTQILYIDNAILGTPLSMFEIKYPDRDILVRVA
jgi:pyoverdine/dityrosine biosynthesis protein Dit1